MRRALTPLAVSLGCAVSVGCSQKPPNDPPPPPQHSGMDKGSKEERPVPPKAEPRATEKE
ncbi:hypothetical protein J0H58_20505 [bacterium]|nr:hypothetical protein [bacterium]